MRKRYQLYWYKSHRIKNSFTLHSVVIGVGVAYRSQFCVNLEVNIRKDVGFLNEFKFDQSDHEWKTDGKYVKLL